MQTPQAAKSILVHALSRLGPGIRMTDLWNRSHAHLRPLDEHLPLPQQQIESCRLCGTQRAVRVIVHLRFGPDHWIHEVDVRYCFACREYSLIPEDMRAHVRASLVWARRNRPLRTLLRYGRLTAVDARLWSATPTVLNLEPTTLCNFNCWYCIGRHMKQGELSFDDCVAALDNFPTLKMIALVGEGEPLMHKRFFDMVRVAKERGIRVSTISNGSAFSQSVIKKICDSGLDYISISIDSVDPETFAQSRIDGDLNKVWAGIERLAKYRNENGFKYPVIGLKGTLFTHTRDEMPLILSEAKKRGVDVVEAFQPLNPKKTYAEIYPADKLALLDDCADISTRIQAGYDSGILPSVMEFAQREQLNISNSGTPNPLRKNCDEEWIYSLLSGDVTPCCQIKNPVDPAWNITKHPLNEIIKNEAYENMRFNLWNGLFLSDCEGCSKTR
jgi:MoaA/NifB/PqqE/SkfB family radical SAM enzyme